MAGDLRLAGAVVADAAGCRSQPIEKAQEQAPMTNPQ